MRPFLRHGRISSPTLPVLVLVVLAITLDSLLDQGDRLSIEPHADLLLMSVLSPLIDLFDDSVKKNTSTQRPRSDDLLLTK